MTLYRNASEQNNRTIRSLVDLLLTSIADADILECTATDARPMWGFLTWYQNDAQLDAGSGHRRVSLPRNLIGSSLDGLRLVSTCDSQYSPQHGNSYRHPSSEHAENGHCKAHISLLCVVVILLSLSMIHSHIQILA
ncbi:hypothetical protein [Pseudomonas frederiksbergensis]|uniref:hypothetical protein n=1 Tax=Pseudomonas frederiksbergensis TaxID=104087 RepID=UPI003D1916E8